MAIESIQSRHAHGEEHLPVLSTTQRERVQHALEAVLASASMRATQQCQTLLLYITEHTLSGETALLRERVIGKEVFGRKPDYEPGEDPVVRIRAADLRKRLALYYQSLTAAPDVRIDIPSGSYRATFTWNDASPEAVPYLPLSEDPHVFTLPEVAVVHSHVEVETHASVAGRWPRRPIILLCLAVMALAVLIAGLAWYRGGNERMLRSAWAPLLDSTKPVLISIGSNAVYRVSDDKADDYSRKNHVENAGMEFFPQFDPAQSYASTGLHPAETSFVALGDVASVSEVVATLAHFNKAFQERFPNDVSFAEVRNNPTVLIGGFNNPMTRELSRNFRYVLASRNLIEDRNQPGKTWELHASSDSHDTEDYAIVTRILRHEEVEPMVIVAGMGQYGTLAATEFLNKPDHLRELNASLGKNWEKQNFQAVLRIKVIDFKPVSTSIIATHTW